MISIMKACECGCVNIQVRESGGYAVAVCQNCGKNVVAKDTSTAIERWNRSDQ